MPILDWLNRTYTLKAATKAPFRLLEEIDSFSYGEDDNENMIIEGDNLDALKSLLPLYAGKVKCIYIDPPYNTRSAFEHYDDNVEHSTWLAMMYPRLECLRELLSSNGSIWVSIDDNEMHYLKVIMDEVFGRKNFVTTIIWQQRTSRENRRVFSVNHEYILLYCKEPAEFAECRNPVELTEEVKGRYKNPDNDPRGPWQSVSLNAQAGHGTPDQFYTLVAPNGKQHNLPKGRCWLYTERRFQEEVAKNSIWFGKDGNGVPRVKKFLSTSSGGLTPETLWLANDVGTNDQAKKHLIQLFPDGSVFETPKPESLVKRIIGIATDPGDIVLDSFLGSGTTAVVAHKMGRKYIGIELGAHCQSHCQPRLKTCIENREPGNGIFQNWNGGGGFRYYRLGTPVFDPDGKINPSVKFNTLANFVWFAETHTPLKKCNRSPFIGVHKETGYYLLFNGILGDKRPDGGNVLTRSVLKELPKHDGTKVIYGETSLINKDKLQSMGIIFKQIPYDVKAR